MSRVRSKLKNHGMRYIIAEMVPVMSALCAKSRLATFARGRCAARPPLRSARASQARGRSSQTSSVRFPRTSTVGRQELHTTTPPIDMLRFICELSGHWLVESWSSQETHGERDGAGVLHRVQPYAHACRDMWRGTRCGPVWRGEGDDVRH